MRFHGKLITLPDYADISPIEVWHRQLEKREIVSKMEQNLHVLFRDRFTLEQTAGTSICITADDYYKLYVNGEYVGQGPASSYHDCYHYNEYDITHLLRQALLLFF
jgi:hypothetical protein